LYGGRTGAGDYSNNGEMLIDDRGQTYVYDAWGRLVAVDPDGASTTSAATVYTYDGLFRRITEDADGSGTTIPTTHLYYSPQWQVVEERIGTDTDAVKQHVWSQVYIDALVLTDRDADTDGNFTDAGERVYALQDANFNMTSLVQLVDHDSNSSTPGTWDVVERYSYDTYGLPTVFNADWTEDSLSGDGKSDVANRYLHQGGRYDDILGLELFGNRDFLMSLGRWTRQDPGGYVDGMSRFEFVSSSPTTYVDPSGLERTPGPIQSFARSGYRLRTGAHAPSAFTGGASRPGPPAHRFVSPSNRFAPQSSARPHGRASSRTPAARAATGSPSPQGLALPTTRSGMHGDSRRNTSRSHATPSRLTPLQRGLTAAASPRRSRLPAAGPLANAIHYEGGKTRPRIKDNG
jgi:RHS repeat-associated protein